MLFIVYKVSFLGFYFISHHISLLFREDQTHQSVSILMIDCGINDDIKKSAGDLILTWKEDISGLSAVILNEVNEYVSWMLLDAFFCQYTCQCSLARIPLSLLISCLGQGRLIWLEKIGNPLRVVGSLGGRLCSKIGQLLTRCTMMILAIRDKYW